MSMVLPMHAKAWILLKHVVWRILPILAWAALLLCVYLWAVCISVA